MYVCLSFSANIVGTDHERQIKCSCQTQCKLCSGRPKPKICILQVYMASNDYAGLIDACSRLGDASRGGDPQLWTVVLEHLTQQEEDVTLQVIDSCHCLFLGPLLLADRGLSNHNAACSLLSSAQPFLAKGGETKY